MTENEAIKKAITYFECMKNDAVVVLDSGFGTHPGESDLVYRNRKMYAELAIQALEKQMPKKPISDDVCEWERGSSGYVGYPAYYSKCCTTNSNGLEMQTHIIADWKYCPYCGKKIKVVE